MDPIDLLLSLTSDMDPIDLLLNLTSKAEEEEGPGWHKVPCVLIDSLRF